MADKSRKYSVYLLVLALIGATIFYGCGNSEHSDSIPGIKYTITGKYSNPQIGDTNISVRASSGSSAGILIYSESDPNNLADIDVANKRYELKNLKPGSHYIIFKHIPNGLSGETYITRSKEPVTITPENPVKESKELIAQKAEYRLTFSLQNPNGGAVNPVPQMYVWGQRIEETTLDGKFITPPMPEVTADLVINGYNYQTNNIPLQFKENPTTYEVTVVDSTSNNKPPVVSLNSARSRYNLQSIVTLTATASDPNNDELAFEWQIESCNSSEKGTLERFRESANESIYYWNSPDTDCTATISVRVYEKNTYQRLQAKAKLVIAIGDGEYRVNNPPVFLNPNPIVTPSVLKGDRLYTLTANATDTDGDALYYELQIRPTNGSGVSGEYKKKTANSWSWKTPDSAEDTSYDLSFKVRDKKHTVSSTTTLLVGKTEPNKQPVIVRKNPSTVTNVTSGNSITLELEANDPEATKMVFMWSCDGGEILSTSQSNTLSSATWKAPYLNVEEDILVHVQITDADQMSVTEPFTVHVIPDPNKKAPQIEISIATPTVLYNGVIPLYKSRETVQISGTATDLNKGEVIDPTFYVWTVIYPDKILTKEIGRQSNTVEFTIDDSSQLGDYTVTLTSYDIDRLIKGTGRATFRVNEPPVAEIKSNGKLVASNTGRVAPQTAYEYDSGSKKYDVYQYNENIQLTAVLSDVETATSALESKIQWTNGDEKLNGVKNFTPTKKSGTLNTVTLSTSDSKDEATSTSYSYFVNGAPIFEIATSTKIAFVEKDNITLSAKVKDDFRNLKMSWYFTYRGTDDLEFKPYAIFKSYSNIDSTSATEINSTINLTASDFMSEYLGNKGGSVKMLLIATDSMGLSTTNASIAFNIEDPHYVSTITVALGSYDKALDQNFKSLPQLTEPYIFASEEKFSIYSSSNKWEGSLQYTYYDTWLDENKNPKENPQTIDSKLLDGNILNGYSISDKFGFHNIRVEAKNIDNAIIASKSFEIFINSTPAIKFADATDADIMRFDTDGTADFNLTITEDNPNERLGLVWTFVVLNENMEEIAPTKKVMHSHDLDVHTSISPITMGGSQKKTISVSSNDIDGLTLASGALRVYACVYDEWNAAATATVDVLINNLPEFADLDGMPGTKLAIAVPDVSDNNEDYSYFKEPYSYIGTAPVYLINQPTMYLDCKVNATDYEMNLCGLNLNTSCNPANQVIWKFENDAQVQPLNATHTSTLSSQGARFRAGKNTVRVELRDTFYYSYNGRFKDLASASLSMDFYIWESQSHNLPSKATAATNIYKMPSTPNSFYVQYSTNNNYINRFEIQSQNKYLSGPIIPGNIYADQQMSTQAEENGNYTYTVATTTLISGIKDYNAKINILTLLSPVDNNDFVMLTDTKAVASPTAIKYRKVDSSYLTIKDNTVEGNIPNVWIPYMRVPDLGETYYRDYLCNNLLIKFKNEEPSSSNQLLNGASKGINTYGYPGNDDNYMNRVISMTQTNDENGAMLIRSWKGTSGNDILAPFDTKYYTYPNENSFRPLSVLDGKALKLTENSKVRFLKDLGLQNKLFVTDTNNNRIIRVANDFSEAYSINVGNPLDVSECSNSTVFVLSDYKDGVATLAISLFNVTDKSYEKACEPFGKLITDASKRNNEFYRVGKFMNPKAMYYYYGSDGYGGLVVLEDGTGSFKSRIQVIRTTMKYWITD